MPDPNRLRFDGVEVYLGAPLQQGSTTIQFDDSLSRAWNNPLPTIDYATTNQYLVLSILDVNYRLKEIVYLRQYTSGSDTGTIVRGQEGTTDASHETGRKVVAAATSEDYLDVQLHNEDPNAHAGLIEDLADGIMAQHLADHEGEANPHPQYVLKTDPILVGPVTIDGDMTVTGDITVPKGSTLKILGTLDVTGIIMINGYQFYVGPTRPGSLPDTAIFVQTVR